MITNLLDSYCGFCYFGGKLIHPLRTEDGFMATQVCPECGAGKVEELIGDEWVLLRSVGPTVWR